MRWWDQLSSLITTTSCWARNSTLSCHTASLFYWYLETEYEAQLDDRIHACLDAGCNGVEVSNGPLGILDWQPTKETINRLRRSDVTFSVHAELNERYGATLARLEHKLISLALPIYNIVFHPTELPLYCNLSNLPWSTSIENMDSKASGWQLPTDVCHAITVSRATGFTYDTAHVMENDIVPSTFTALFPPMEVHLSVSTRYSSHATTYNQLVFPYIPKTPLIVLEGVMINREALSREVKYVQERLKYI